MRLFQNSGIYTAYRPRLARLTADCRCFSDRRNKFLEDRYSACHILEPVYKGNETTFFTNGDDLQLQKMWAHENGLSSKSTLESILLAQIEHHRTEVFYNLDPMRYGNKFVASLPGCVKCTIAWRAAPSGSSSFSAYDRVVCNFQSILRDHEANGCNSAYFAPSHDPVMDRFAANAYRPIDVLFVGGYSRHHQTRAEMLEKVANMGSKVNIVFHLDRSRLTRLAESTIGKLPLLNRFRCPQSIRKVSANAVFGLDLYAALSSAKIVLNGAVDMAGKDRGNMRCWEAMGCGALMLSDEGVYPSNMKPNRDFALYKDASDVVDRITSILSDFAVWQPMADHGRLTVSTEYSKSAQWLSFLRIVESI